MNGFQNEVSLLGQMKDMGLVGNFESAPAADWQRIASDATSGKPTIISTTKHYFTASDYKSDKGFYVGASGTDLTGGSEWMTQAQIESKGGGVNGAIHLKDPILSDRQQFLEANAPGESSVPTPKPPPVGGYGVVTPADKSTTPVTAKDGTPTEDPTVAALQKQVDSAHRWDSFGQGILGELNDVGQSPLQPIPQPQLAWPKLPGVRPYQLPASIGYGMG